MADGGIGVERLRAFLGGAADGALLVVTGAGISLASGIDTFRGADPGAVWAHDVTTRGTFSWFEADPVGSWSWYLARFDRVLAARPNPAHAALADLERRCAAAGRPFLLVTQNVDPLHERAGSRALVKVHGSADRARCTTRGCLHAAPAGSLPRPAEAIARFLEAPSRDTLPRCPACGGLLRQHVLWFDETYDSHADYDFVRVIDAATAARRVLFVGTSFSVGVTDLVVRAGRRRGVPMLAIDPAAAPPPPGVEPLRARAEEALPAALAPPAPA